MPRAPLVLAALVVVLGLAGCGGGQEHEHGTGASPVTVTGGSGRFAGGELDPPSSSPDFTLEDPVAGEQVSMADQRGKVVLVTFLYTNCPDVCPLITQNLNQALKQLGAGKDDVRVLAVSVDPEGDTPEAVREYAKAHHLVPEFHYLIGTHDELLQVWKAYKVAAVERNPELVDHTAYTKLVDQEGQGRVIYDSGVTSAEVVHDVKVLLAR
jgi:protein SCO1/2